MLRPGRFIAIPTTGSTLFDHGAFDERSGRVFVAHSAANAVDVIDAHGGRHLQTLPGYPEAAGVVMSGEWVAITNRGAASLSLLNPATLARGRTFATGVRPNGLALAPRRGVAIVACVGDDENPPLLQRIDLATGATETLALPGRPRWCVVDTAEERVFCAIRDPSLVFVAGLAPFVERAHWPLPSGGGHGIDLDPAGGRLFVACDGGRLVGLAVDSGQVLGQWPLPGVPDATFFNPATGRVHVAVGDPGLIVSVDPASGAWTLLATEPGAKTMALAPPDRLFVFLPVRGGALELREEH